MMYGFPVAAQAEVPGSQGLYCVPYSQYGAAVSASHLLMPNSHTSTQPLRLRSYPPQRMDDQLKIQLRTATELGRDMSESAVNLRSFSFVLAVPDLTRTASYFRDALGFHLEWPEGSGWQLLSRGNVRIMIGHCPDAMSPSTIGDHSYFGYLNVDDADALHSELVERGATILQPPTNRPHGMREFVIATPDGHRMMVGQELPAAN